jgi:hypothetical protein
MDIHPPEHPIRSVRDFLIQIFTVTCGIVIALGLEALVESRRDAKLLAATRQDFATEIAENLKKTQEVHDAASHDEAWIRAAVAYGTAMLKHDTSKRLDNIGSRRFVVLRNSAWETALATQAIRLLPFGEARALAAAYNDQAALNEFSARARDQWIGVAMADDVASLSDPEIRSALGLLRVAYAYTASMEALEGRLIEEYKAAQQAISGNK